MKNLGYCGGGDWRAMMLVQQATLDEFHDYSVEWLENDIVFRIDEIEIYRNTNQGDQFLEPIFAISNFPK